MKIFIDIGHPAHVHYFRNFIKLMKQKGHDFCVTARNKEMSHCLLTKYNIPFHNRGKGRNSVLGKIKYLLQGDLILFRHARKFRPDVFLSFSSPYAAQVAWLMNKPHIAFDDTEHAKIARLFYKPFTKNIISPSCFKTELGKKHIKFDSYMELCYLHPNYFLPYAEIRNLLNLQKNEKYVILRFVAWKGNHDFGHKGLSDANKIKVVQEFSKYAKVFITSESRLPVDIQDYSIKFPPEIIHEVLASADLLYGESATMASESAVLGVPAIYLDDVGRGYTDEEESKYNLVFNFSESEEDQCSSINKGIEILKKPMYHKWKKLHQKLLSEKIDVTAFMVWFLENFPESAKIIKENPDYQYRFK